MSSTDFYLSGLNIEVTGVKLEIPGGDNTDAFDSSLYHAKAELECPVSFAQHLFQWHTDARDVQDLNVDDLKFRVFQVTSTGSAGGISDITYYNTRNLLVGHAIVTDDAITYYGSSSATNNEKTILSDHPRHVSYKLMGTAEGVDIFTNERASRLYLLEQSVIAFVNNIGNTANVDWNGNDSHPAKAAFKQILASFPGRLTPFVQHGYATSDNSTLTPDSTTTADVWYYMPFEANDNIFFILNVKAATGQDSVITGDTDGSTVTDRKYLIKLKLVDNLTGSADGAYTRAWTAAGPDFTAEPAYLQPNAVDDTVF